MMHDTMVLMLTHKTCRACGLAKPVEEFSPIAGGVGARAARCKSCLAEAARKRRAAAPDAVRAANRRYYANQSDEQRARSRAQNAAAQRARRARLSEPQREVERERERVSRAAYRATPEGAARDAAARARYEETHHEERLRAQRIARAADPERFAEYQRRWVAANPEKARAIQRSAEARRRSAEADGDLTAEQWAAIVEEFGGLCAWCETAEGAELDHVVPLVRGGQHTAGNVVPACRRCNASKGDRLACEWLGFSEPGRAA